MKYPQLVSMPSAVSDWLEEQLEARGIDATVYTRYVLSLLHRDTLDLICTDQDFQSPKEVRHSGRSRKRFRRSAEWWNHVRVDVDQLRRSAAVECLMSASDQKCGIESLVDELCEKLKDFESNSSRDIESESTTETKPEKEVDSPHDPAKRYYAAFPPLTCKPGSANLISLIPQLYNKRHQNKKAPLNRSISCGEKQLRKCDIDNMKSRSGGKPRFSHFARNKKDFGFTRSMEKTGDCRETLSDWDMYLIHRQNRAGDEGYSTSDTLGMEEFEDAYEDESADAAANPKTIVDDGHLAKLVAKFDRSIEALWNTETAENIENEYHDLPVDIQGLLSSPVKENAVEILNVANKRVGNKSRAFIQCGTNIKSSIWSERIPDEEDTEKSLYDSINYSNLYNESLETYPAKTLGDQFNSLSMGADKLNDNLFLTANKTNVGENDANALYESLCNDNMIHLGEAKFDGLNNEFISLPWECTAPIGRLNNKKWSEAENYSYIGDTKFCSPLDPISFKRNIVSESLNMLNHNKEKSCFREVVPKQVLGLPAFTASQNEPDITATTPTDPKDEEDLLTSARTHFRPIKQDQIEVFNTNQGHYSDGTEFLICSSYNRVNYKRSDSGTMYLESMYETPKRYMEYKIKDVSDKWDVDNESCCSIEREFVLKFCVKQNEKCCQTEVSAESDLTSHSPQEVPAKKRVLCDPEEFFFPGDEELLSDTVMENATVCECNCSRTRAKLATNLESLFNASTELCSLHGARPDSMTSEINWNNNWKKCDKCNNNWSSVWSSKMGPWQQDPQSLQQIWSSSEELCKTCIGVPAGSGTTTGRSIEYFKLREELSQDGEQLLSDLSCLQRSYMEQLPQTEVSCDLTDCFSATLSGGSKERKRRHSSSQRSAAVATAVARNSWTNASCLKNEYKTQHALLAVGCLRPVTL